MLFARRPLTESVNPRNVTYIIPPKIRGVRRDCHKYRSSHGIDDTSLRFCTKRRRTARRWRYTIITMNYSNGTIYIGLETPDVLCKEESEVNLGVGLGHPVHHVNNSRLRSPQSKGPKGPPCRAEETDGRTTSRRDSGTLGRETLPRTAGSRDMKSLLWVLHGLLNRLSRTKDGGSLKSTVGRGSSLGSYCVCLSFYLWTLRTHLLVLEYSFRPSRLYLQSPPPSFLMKIFEGTEF